MWKKVFQMAFGKECELRERMFRMIVIVGGMLSLIGIIESILVAGTLLIPIVLLFLVMAVCMFVTFRYRKIDIAAMLAGFVIIAVVFPVMFFYSGGIEGGATIWFALGLFYIFIMFTGKRLALFLILAVIIYAFTYGLGYFFPELVNPMASRMAVYVDSFFGIIAVGMGGGLILKFQMKIFELEHMLALEQKEELERNNKARNVLFANMSHEIRTPINTIIGLDEMILRINPTGETREYAQDIQIASKLLLNQVNDILDLSQMEMKKMKIIPMEYQTKELFRELIELIRVRMEKKGLQFCLDIDRNLPSVLYGDEKRLKQVFLNILDNALKYTREGSVTLSAFGEESSGEEMVLKVKVADTGIGIRKEDMEHIFDSFKRSDEKKNAHIEGSGLGLAITKQLVELMDGEITVDSVYTKGTVFTVILRQKIIDGTPIGCVDFLERGREDGEYYHPSFEAPEARVLVVDDNRLNSTVASRLLQSTKVQIDIANSGAECLEKTKQKYYHVILMDYMMPEMNGAETLKELRKQENGLCRDTAVVVLTANTLAGARELYQEYGFDGYLEKPIQGKLLENEILRFLPQDIIEYQEENTLVENPSQIQRISRNKRKRIYVTSDCLCDIPPELLEKYDIKLMYLYIETEHGCFMDTREIDADSLTQHFSVFDSSAHVKSVTVEEHEEFFAELLTQAESVIHISSAPSLGECYDNAVAAARGFGHVHIIDSGQVSCGQGLVTLYAAKLAMEGWNLSEICAAVEKMRDHVQARFVMPGADIFYQNGRTGALTARMCRIFQLHPLIVMRQQKTVIAGVLPGSIEDAWKQGIHWHLRNKKKICRDVVFIMHVGCSVRQQEWIRSEILKCIPFEKVIMQKASFSIACNSGLETIGIAYYSL